MFVLGLLTLVLLGVVVAAGVMIGCAVPNPGLFGDGGTALCDHLGDLGLVEDPLIAIGFGLAAMLAAALMWRLALNRWRRKRRVESTGSLVNNINRLVETSQESGPLGEQSVAGSEIWERVDDLESRMRSSSLPGREVASTWLNLLRRANDLHNRGQLPTEDFKSMNTRLLDLVSEDSDRTEHATVG